MSITGMIGMWVMAAIVFVLLNYWPTGKEYDQREEYWARFEGR